MTQQKSSKIKKVLIVEDHKDALNVLANVAKKAFDSPTIVFARTLAQGF